MANGLSERLREALREWAAGWSPSVADPDGVFLESLEHVVSEAPAAGERE